MPPLRERREDLPALVLAFAQRAAREYGKSIQGVSRKALALLAAYDWPGNVRELKNEVERAVLLCPDGGVLESAHFGPVAWAVEQRPSAADGPNLRRRARHRSRRLWRSFSNRSRRPPQTLRCRNNSIRSNGE